MIGKKVTVKIDRPSKIDFNGKKQGNEIARKKWEEDILFVTTYDTESQIRISGTFKRPYQK